MKSELRMLNSKLNETNQMIDELEKLRNIIKDEMDKLEVKIEKAEREALMNEIKAKLSSCETSTLREVLDLVEEGVEPSSTPTMNDDKYSIIFEKGDEKVKEMADKVNEALKNVINEPIKGEPTIFDISDIVDNKVNAIIDFNVIDLEYDEQKIKDVVTTVLTSMGIKYTMDDMPSVDLDEYFYPIKIEMI